MSKLNSLYYLFFPLLIGGIVGILIVGSIDYSNLTHPSLSPPSILFPIAWTMLYLLLGISYYILKKEDKDTPQIQKIYYLQLLINACWPLLFFLLKLRFFSIIWIIVLDLLVAYMIYLFRQQNKLAAYLNIPYLLWILFATYLNISIYILN